MKEEEAKSKARHKETFFQPADSGIPAHWVVQFYIDGQAFCEAVYFDSYEKAAEFEEELINKGE